VQEEIETGLRTQLLNQMTIATLTESQVYNEQAPETARHPFLVFSVNAGGSINDTANRYVDMRYLVKAVTASGDSGPAAERAAELADAIYTALHGQDFAMGASWQLVRCQHLTVVKYVENQSNRQYFHNGGIYRVRAYGGDLI